ncbi:uncharacterized protein [Notamacropus eugenii]|uniref:uncharacterized protein n=1 Tax=Notamacropus eugenii TaxID=9315 RepID=UPI003B67E752
MWLLLMLYFLGATGERWVKQMDTKGGESPEKGLSTLHLQMPGWLSQMSPPVHDCDVSLLELASTKCRMLAKELTPQIGPLWAGTALWTISAGSSDKRIDLHSLLQDFGLHSFEGPWARRRHFSSLKKGGLDFRLYTSLPLRFLLVSSILSLSGFRPSVLGSSVTALSPYPAAKVRGLVLPLCAPLLLGPSFPGASGSPGILQEAFADAAGAPPGAASAPPPWGGAWRKRDGPGAESQAQTGLCI